jgi:AAA family ATP:ADP antiporter
MLLVLNLVNTTGEFVLSNAIRERALSLASDPALLRELVKGMYADFFSWVNLVAFLLQAFAVSRIIDKLGVRRALFVMPAIVFGAYGAIAAIGGFTLIRTAKIFDNATDYSLQNTVRQSLFLRTSRAAKFKAKAAIDTFFVRAGTFRVRLLEIGVALELHQVRIESIDELAAALREHAAREDALLYRWASDQLDPELAASARRHVSRHARAR